MENCWTSVDPVAFVEIGKRVFCPLLLSIGVEPRSTAYDIARTTAEKVKAVVMGKWYSDFEVALRESVVTRTSKGPQLPGLERPDINPIVDLEKPSTPPLGLCITPLKTPYSEGTDGLDLRESKESGRVLLLTCAHVARPPREHQNGEVTREKSQSREQIIVKGKGAISGGLNGEGRKAALMQNESRNKIDGGRERLCIPSEFWDDTTKQWSNLQQRIIGNVSHVPASVQPQKFTQNWALIELDTGKFDWESFPGNKMYVASAMPFVSAVMIAFRKLSSHDQAHRHVASFRVMCAGVRPDVTSFFLSEKKTRQQRQAKQQQNTNGSRAMNVGYADAQSKPVNERRSKFRSNARLGFRSALSAARGASLTDSRLGCLIPPRQDLMTLDKRRCLH
ncbi:hypothetical protein KEM56_000183 [Ascosphaera pollenicola]|nr:hypothetical protein KEM56_000183 [Ascosphaera pollenicola]